MRVLTVAESLLEVILEEEFLVKTGSLTHVSCDHHIVLCSVGICLCRQLETGFLCGVAEFLDLCDNLSIILRIADYCNCAPVLCGRTKH